MHSDDLPFDVVISHGPCIDGVTAAWIVWRTLPEEYREKLRLKGGSYGKTDVSEDLPINSSSDEYPVNSLLGAEKMQKEGYSVVFAFAHPNEEIPLNLIKDKRVLWMDIDPSEQLPLLLENAKFLTIIDHHDSTEDTLKNNKDLLEKYEDKVSINLSLNSKKDSAATMIWESISEEPIPDFVNIVRIGDTWAFDEKPELKAKNILTALKIEKVFKTFDKMEETYLMWNDKIEQYKNMGAMANRYENILITKAAKKVALGYLVTKDEKIYTVAYTAANILHSEIGFALRFYAEQRFKQTIDFCATWKYVPHEEVVIVSLRSPRTDLNLAEIARDIKLTDGKGGGHYDAASFTFKGIENFHLYFRKSKEGGYKGKNYDPLFNKRPPIPERGPTMPVRIPPVAVFATPYTPTTYRMTPSAPTTYLIQPTRGSQNMSRDFRSQ